MMVFVIAIVITLVSVAATLFFEGQDDLMKKYNVECEGVTVDPKEVFQKQM